MPGSHSISCRERLALTGVDTRELRFDLIGVNALHGETLASGYAEPYEVRARVAGRTGSLAHAVRIGNEVETLYTNGPAGGGGVTRSAREVVAVQSVLLPQRRTDRYSLNSLRRDMKLRELAHSRTKRQGQYALNISVICYDAKSL